MYPRECLHTVIVMVFFLLSIPPRSYAQTDSASRHSGPPWSAWLILGAITLCAILYLRLLLYLAEKWQVPGGNGSSPGSTRCQTDRHQNQSYGTMNGARNNPQTIGGLSQLPASANQSQLKRGDETAQACSRANKIENTGGAPLSYPIDNSPRQAGEGEPIPTPGAVGARGSNSLPSAHLIIDMNLFITRNDFGQMAVEAHEIEISRSALTMSFDDLNCYLNDAVDEPALDGRPGGEAVDLDADIEVLRSLIAESAQLPSDDSELSELLAHLDGADTMAGEVEAKLDEILGTLDNLLDNLEPKNDDNSLEGDKAGSPSQSQSESPPPNESGS